MPKLSQILYHYFKHEYICLFLLLYKESYPNKHTEVFKRETQPNEMAKALCEHIVVNGVVLINDNFSFFSLKLCKKKKR